jgi:hypothetical protein
LSGVRPIEGDSIGQIVMHLMSTGITPLEHLVPGLPSDVTALVGRMLSRERARRPEDLREVADILGHHTTVDAPLFGAPGTSLPQDDTEDSLEPAPSKVVVSAGGADSRVDTQRATDSLANAMSSTVRSPPRRRQLAIGAALALAVAVGAWAFLRPRSQPVAEEPSEAAPRDVRATAAAPGEPSETSVPPIATLAEPALAPNVAAAANDAGATSSPSRRERDVTHSKPAKRAAPAAPPVPEKAPTTAAPTKPAHKGGLAETPPF